MSLNELRGHAKMTNTDKEYMTVNEVAEALQVNATTVTRWWKKFGLPLYRLARCVVRIRRSDFEEFMKNHETGIYYSTMAEFGYPAIANPANTSRRALRIQREMLGEELEARRKERERVLNNCHSGGTQLEWYKRMAVSGLELHTFLEGETLTEDRIDQLISNFQTVAKEDGYKEACERRIAELMAMLDACMTEEQGND